MEQAGTIKYAENNILAVFVASSNYFFKPPAGAQCVDESLRWRNKYLCEGAVSISALRDIIIWRNMGPIVINVSYPGGPVRVNRPISRSSESPWWARNVHMCRLLSSSKVTSSTWTYQCRNPFRWSLKNRRNEKKRSTKETMRNDKQVGQRQRAEELLTSPGGGGSEPAWLRRSRHEGPWTPHLELRTWVRVKEKSGALPHKYRNIRRSKNVATGQPTLRQ